MVIAISRQIVFARTMIKAKSQTRQPLRPYQQLRYWSNVPFRHGSTDVVKYSASPCAGNPARPLQTNNPNALQDELIRHLNEDTTMSSFDFGLQFLDSDRMTYRGKRSRRRLLDRECERGMEGNASAVSQGRAAHASSKFAALGRGVRGHVHRRDRPLDAGQHSGRGRQSRPMACGVGQPEGAALEGDVPVGQALA